MICDGENHIDECYLVVVSEDVASAHNFMATFVPPLLPFRSDSGIGYASKKLSIMVGNSASYSLNSW